MKKLLGRRLVAAVLLTFFPCLAGAVTLDFNSVETELDLFGLTEDGFSLVRTHDGMHTLKAGEYEDWWRGNGTGRLLTFSNSGDWSGITLTRSDGGAFSLQSFAVANGFVSGSRPILSLQVNGAFAGGGTISASFNDGFGDWSTVSLPSSWSGLSSVVFLAYGGNNRAVWDNISVNESTTAVPEPGTLALLGGGVACLGWRVRGRRR